MPSTLTALSETIEAWLTQEERALSRLTARRDEPVIAERLRLWKERVRAYERLECVLAERRAEQRERIVPDAIEQGLRLVS